MNSVGPEKLYCTSKDETSYSTETYSQWSTLYSRLRESSTGVGLPMESSTSLHWGRLNDTKTRREYVGELTINVFSMMLVLSIFIMDGVLGIHHTDVE